MLGELRQNLFAVFLQLKIERDHNATGRGRKGFSLSRFRGETLVRLVRDVSTKSGTQRKTIRFLISYGLQKGRSTLLRFDNV